MIGIDSSRRLASILVGCHAYFRTDQPLCRKVLFHCGFQSRLGAFRSAAIVPVIAVETARATRRIDFLDVIQTIKANQTLCPMIIIVCTLLERSNANYGDRLMLWNSVNMTIVWYAALRRFVYSHANRRNSTGAASPFELKGGTSMVWLHGGLHRQWQETHWKDGHG